MTKDINLLLFFSCAISVYVLMHSGHNFGEIHVRLSEVSHNMRGNQPVLDVFTAVV